LPSDQPYSQSFQYYRSDRNQHAATVLPSLWIACTARRFGIPI
jgi:hypothetical protein